MRAVLTPADEGDRRGRPVRRPGALARSFASWACPVLEDAAQAAGASLDGRRAGSLGDVATFSFYPSKNLGAFGDGGAITTDDDRVAELVRALRFHGSRDKQTFEYVGYNSRLDELQAAILRVAAARARRLVRRPARRRRAYAEAGIEQYVTPPACPPAPSPPGTCTWPPTRAPTS